MAAFLQYLSCRDDVMKGQYFSFDAIIASVIFLMAIVLLLSYWHSIKTFLDYQTSDVMRESMRIASLLFVPPDGSLSCTGVNELGFALSWDDRRVDQSAIDVASGCAAAESEWLKLRLSTPHEVYIKVNYLDGTSPVDIGEEPDPDSVGEVANMRRAAAVVQSDGTTKLATFDIYIYR
jgi:hypothetical protein